MAATETRSVVDFLNHGLLPFVGREIELRRLLKFAEGDFAADSLRVLLISGEAGSGKSRLLHESRPMLEGRGVIIQAKIYPETSGAVSPLIAEELRLSEQAFPLLRDPVEPGRASVAGALRRLAGLRPLLLLIEDVHLLAGDALADFAALLDSLADEPFSLICTSRPNDQGVRNVLERFLSSAITLELLSEERLAELWRELFGEVEEDAVKLLAETTCGNPLAVRSALRSLVGSGGLAYGGGAWRIAVDRETFSRELERSVRRFSAGMTVHLAPPERKAAESLALLGEVFSHEAAESMIEDAGEMVRLLLYRGILTRSTTSVDPLPNLPHTSSSLLAFTHTLVHQEFMESGRPDVRRLARIIIERKPIYTILPFQVFERLAQDIGDDPVVPTLVRECFILLLAFYPDPVGSRGVKTIANTIRVIVANRRSLLPAEKDEADAELALMEMLVRIIVGLQEDVTRLQTDEWKGLIESALDISRGLRREYPDLHFLSLSFFVGLQLVRGRSVIPEVFAEVRGMIEENPDIRFGDFYISMLNKLLEHWREPDKGEIVRYVERELDEILHDPRASATLRDSALIGLGTALLSLYDTPDEYEARHRLFRTIEGECLRNPALRGRFLFESRFHILRFVWSAGLFPQLLDYCRAIESLGMSVGDRLLSIAIHFYRVRGLAGFGVDFAELCRILIGEYRCLPDFHQAHNRASTANLLGTIGVLRGEDQMMLDTFGEVGLSHEEIPVVPRVGLILARLIEGNLHACASDHALPSLLSCSLRLLLREVEPADEDMADLRELIAEPLIRTEEFAPFHVLLILLECEIGHAGYVNRGVRSDVRRTLLGGLAWLEERGLFGFMVALLERGKVWLTAKEVKEKRVAVNRLREEFRKEASPDGNRIRLSVFGVVAITVPGQEPKRIVGGRTLTLLGVLLLNRMTQHRLSYEEIVRMVAGSDVDYEIGVKGLQVSIFRLREAIGRECVLTARRSPELNTELLDVDLLRGLDLLDESERLLQKGGGLHGVGRNLEEVLDIAAQGVLFPTLYHELFETAREEFENRLRRLLIAAARRLHALADLTGVESLVRKAPSVLGRIEEVEELLADLLEKEGKPLQAFRVREGSRDVGA